MAAAEPEEPEESEEETERAPPDRDLRSWKYKLLTTKFMDPYFVEHESWTRPGRRKEELVSGPRTERRRTRSLQAPKRGRVRKEEKDLLDRGVIAPLEFNEETKAKIEAGEFGVGRRREHNTIEKIIGQVARRPDDRGGLKDLLYGKNAVFTPASVEAFEAAQAAETEGMREGNEAFSAYGRAQTENRKRKADQEAETQAQLEKNRQQYIKDYTKYVDQVYELNAQRRREEEFYTAVAEAESEHQGVRYHTAMEGLKELSDDARYASELGITTTRVPHRDELWWLDSEEEE